MNRTEEDKLWNLSLSGNPLAVMVTDLKFSTLLAEPSRKTKSERHAEKPDEVCADGMYLLKSNHLIGCIIPVSNK